MKKRSFRYLLLISFIIISVMLTSCSSKNATEYSPAPQSNPDFTVAENEAAGVMPTTTSTQTTNRKLIVKIFMEMRVDNIDKSILDVEAKSAAVGGYTREAHQNENSGRLIIMIPAEQLDTFTTSLKSLGKVINSTRNSEDVTDSYFDTQIRIKNLEAEIETMRNLLQKQGWKVSEILEIEREIRRLTDELESLKGYLTNLDRQITYSEVQIRFEKSQIALDNANQSDLGYKLKLALRNGLNLLESMITSILSLIAFILPITPFIAIAYFILRKPIRRITKKNQQDSKK